MAIRQTMDIHTKEIQISSQGLTDIIDITGRVERILEGSGIRDGLITVSVPGSTAAITTIEYEPGLVSDLKRAFEKLAPAGDTYAHDQAWGDGNGFSHVRAAMTGAARSFPVSEGKMLLGTWQQIVLIDFDNRPRRRAVIVQVMGR
jgi:secondary thiamine-phosphate synthase enzyme